MKRAIHDQDESQTYGAPQPRSKEIRRATPSSTTVAMLMNRSRAPVIGNFSAPLIQPVCESILCESCGRARLAPLAPLTGICRFCSRGRVCGDCAAFCDRCGSECCTVCSVKDYSARETVVVCLDCGVARGS